MGFGPNKGINLFCDNKAAIEISQKPCPIWSNM